MNLLCWNELNGIFLSSSFFLSFQFLFIILMASFRTKSFEYNIQYTFILCILLDALLLTEEFVRFLFLGEVDDLIKKLKSTPISDGNGIEVTQVLQTLNTSAESNPMQYEGVDVIDNLIKVFATCQDNRVREEAAKTIAEITKTDTQRKRFTNATVIHELLKLLEGLNDGTLAMATQSCRALGNICYHNDDARNLILEAKGDAALIGLLDFALNVNNERHLTFGRLRCGLISNYLVGGENLAKNAMDLNIMGKIETIVNDSCSDVETNEDILCNTLPLLSLLTENVADLNFSTQLNANLSKILGASKNPDIAEMCLEMLQYQAENGRLKKMVAMNLCGNSYGFIHYM